MRIETYFQYLHKPDSRDLMIQEKVAAFALSIVMGLFTLGLAQLVTYALEKHRITHELARNKDKQTRFHEVLRRTDGVAKNILSPSGAAIAEQRAHLGSLVQNHFIDSYYGKAFPKRNDVQVPHLVTNKMTRWGSLSLAQKVQVNNNFAHPHTRLEGFKKLFAEFYVVPPGQSIPYLAHDPRKIHGNDHCARVAIFSAVFAALYLKYHPECKLSEEDLLIIQLVAAGHDSGRDSDGTDVWDEKSADNTIKKLREMGFTDESLLDKCHKAIVDKDSKPNAEKSFIAKCVQNADCADFPRLNLFSPEQSDKEFAESRGYLDIYKEFSDNENLLYELDSIRKEMNELIFNTSSRCARAELSQPGKNVYDEILNQITSQRYPLLYKTLTDMNNVSIPNHEIPLWRKEVDGLEILLNQPGGLGYITEARFKELTGKIQLPSSFQGSIGDVHVAKSQRLQKKLKHLLVCQQEFEKNLANVARNRHRNEIKLLAAYEKLVPSQKDLFRAQVLKEVKFRRKEFAYNYPALFADIEHARMMKGIETLPSRKAISRARAIVANFNRVNDSSLKDTRQLTAAALLYKQAAAKAMDAGDSARALSILQEAGERIPVNIPQLELKNLFPSKSATASNEIYCLLRGARHFRHHRLRVNETDIEGQRHLQLSFELTLAARNDLQKYIELLQKCGEIEVTKVPAVYHPKKGNETLINDNGMEIGEDYLIRFKSGLEFRIGAEEKYKNQHTFGRITFKQDISQQEVHKAFAMLGLPVAMLPPRKEDIDAHIRACALNLLHPDKAYKNFPKLPSEKVYKSLSEAQKNEIEEYVKSATCKVFGGRSIEVVCPKVVEEVKKEGAVGLGSFLFGGGIDQISDTVSKILQSGVLSAQERYQRGILSGGYVPKLNYQTGSGNQVFARTLTANQLEANKSYDDFALNSPVLALIDIEAYERMPYFYHEDRGGLRNGNYSTPIWYAPRQGMIHSYKGKNALLDRPPLKEFIREIDKTQSFANETIFNHTFDPQYFRGLLVESEYDKIRLCDQLQKRGIHQINGKALDEAVMVSKQIMRKHFEAAQAA